MKKIKISGEINGKKKEVSQLSYYIYIPHPVLSILPISSISGSLFLQSLNHQCTPRGENEILPYVILLQISHIWLMLLAADADGLPKAGDGGR